MATVPKFLAQSPNERLRILQAYSNSKSKVICKMMSLLEMASKLVSVAVETEIAGQIAVEQAARIVMANAKDAIGRGYDNWPDLADSTIEDKERQGYGVPLPLFRTGELKDSIEATIGHHRAWVGSNEDKAIWQELGTDRIPPRSFLRMAAIESEDVIHGIAAKTIGRAFAGHGASLIVEGLHVIKEGAEYACEKIDESNDRH